MWINNVRTANKFWWKYIKVFKNYIRFNTELTNTLELYSYKYCHIGKFSDNNFVFYFVKEPLDMSIPFIATIEKKVPAIRVACKQVCQDLLKNFNNIIPIEYTKEENCIKIKTTKGVNYNGTI